jgi:hypothetical protein
VTITLLLLLWPFIIGDNVSISQVDKPCQSTAKERAEETVLYTLLVENASI